jgi:iron(II)-dependent oxidoreductase
LSDEQMMGPRFVLNPLLWEIGHVAWFMEQWVFRRQGGDSILAGADALYDSSRVANATRWDIALKDRARTERYLQDVLDKVLSLLDEGQASGEDCYHIRYALAHEQMHCEAFTRTLQWHGFRAPDLGAIEQPVGGGPRTGDVQIAGGTLPLGAEPGDGFAFDNEKWAHPVEVAPFAIARAPVTQAEFAAFVEDGGYQRPELWSVEARAWLEGQGAPLTWRRAGGGWERRDFDRWVPLEPHRPASQVNAYEAGAWCAWAGRRLPTEAEWECAASWDGQHHRRDAPADANFDWRALGCVDVGAHGSGDSPLGCRQMMGNVWEWTADPFRPFPGFVPDPYEDYSKPWFESHTVLKGGSWACFASLHRTSYRNFLMPERQDAFTGFRTCVC